MIFGRPASPPPVVRVPFSVIRLDADTILVRAGGTYYHVNAGDFSLTLAKGTEVVAEIVAGQAT